MEKKVILIEVFTKIKPYCTMASTFLLLIRKCQITEEVLDTCMQWLLKIARLTENSFAKWELLQSYEVLKYVRIQEIKSRKEEQEWLDDLLLWI